MSSAEKFVRIGAKDNFYQTSAFIPMSFALVTTVHENGETGIGPHALLYPFGIGAPHSMLLISRSNSGTAVNIRRTGKCALNYVEFDRERLRSIANLGYPGQSLDDKRKASTFTLTQSPSPDKAGDPQCPQIIAEAVQVFECTWDDSFDLNRKSDDEDAVTEGRFVLTIDHILMQEKYEKGVEEGAIFPSMPIFYGYRANRGFWFAEHRAPFSVPLPEVKGQEGQAVFYLANRLDEHVRFTREACEQLTGIPGPFIKEALKGIIAVAHEHDVTEVDVEFLEIVNAERQ
jgi:flavin reductase (DIM6/NTAB) family NADH-FMN oxidoreductase RutF